VHAAFAAAPQRQRRPHCAKRSTTVQLQAHRGGDLSLENEVFAEVKRVEKVSAVRHYGWLPEAEHNKPEFAVFGLSNAGKSSLVNYLVGRKLLATISKNPGHTQKIGHYLVDKSWYLVDLPGIGLARVSNEKKQQMDGVLRAYLQKRTTLCEVLYVVDGSKPPTKLDLLTIKWLADAGVDMSIIFTKADLDKRGEAKGFEGGAVALLSEKLYDMEGSPWRLKEMEFPPMYLTSAAMKWGKQSVLDRIAHRRREWFVGISIATGSASKQARRAIRKMEAQQALAEKMAITPPEIR